MCLMVRTSKLRKSSPSRFAGGVLPTRVHARLGAIGESDGIQLGAPEGRCCVVSGSYASGVSKGRYRMLAVLVSEARLAGSEQRRRHGSGLAPVPAEARSPVLDLGHAEIAIGRGARGLGAAHDLVAVGPGTRGGVRPVARLPRSLVDRAPARISALCCATHRFRPHRPRPAIPNRTRHSLRPEAWLLSSERARPPHVGAMDS